MWHTSGRSLQWIDCTLSQGDRHNSKWKQIILANSLKFIQGIEGVSFIGWINWTSTKQKFEILQFIYYFLFFHCCMTSLSHSIFFERHLTDLSKLSTSPLCDRRSCPWTCYATAMTLLNSDNFQTITKAHISFIYSCLLKNRCACVCFVETSSVPAKFRLRFLYVRSWRATFRKIIFGTHEVNKNVTHWTAPHFQCKTSAYLLFI